MYKNFISAMFFKDIAILKAEDNTRVRLENIAWPSECSADVGPYSVGECQRSLFYKILGVQPTDDMSLRGAYICDAGLMYEKYHIERFKSMDILKQEQYRIEFETDTPNKVKIAGKIDCLINDNDIIKAIEIKSISAFKAPDVFGHNGKLPLPSPNNLMQAMLYKHWTVNTEAGKNSRIEEVYLMYINRSDNSTFYYRIDLDDQGYAIITALDQVGKELYTLKLQEQKSYDELIAGKFEDQELARLAELRLSTRDIFNKFDRVYDYVRSKTLPPKDFKSAYSPEDLNQAVSCGKITKRKLTMLKKSGESYSDYKCTICPYIKKCLSDSGISLITF
jgi:hypothetical protein